jgi:Fe-S-cluster containining protein
VETWFTFPDGGLKYDCPSCGQQCCRGRGFALGGGELVQLLRKAPELAPHLYLRAGGSIGAVDVTDGCWFLDAGGNCDLEVRHGRATKPSTCRLFPFNRVFKVGEVRVVDMNSVLCPLQPAAGDGVRWTELSREIDELAGSPLVDVAATTPLDLPPDWLVLERRLQDEDPMAAAPSLFADRLTVYQTPNVEREAQVRPLLKLLAPSLRFNTLFRKEGGGPYAHLIDFLPRRVRALGLLASLANRPSLRSLTEMWTQESALLDVLTNWEEPVSMTQPRFDADVPEPLQPALGALLGGAYRGGKTLGDLVKSAAATLEPPLRPLAVALAASQMLTLFPFGC